MIATEREGQRGALALPAACLAALVVACYGGALFGGGQFAFRDAGHFYYPLYERVVQEWRSGRLPLWEPEENGGMPLLGHPSAAVLYPGKLLVLPLPYPWQVRVYTVGHTLLACGGAWWLVRGWGVSRTGAGVAAMAYAFAGPVLFLHCNITYLVGASWMPFAFGAADRWLRLGRRPGLVGLAVVVALQTMGGDPQAAYVEGLCGAGYGAGLALARGGGRWWRRALGVLAVLAVARWASGGLPWEGLAATWGVAAVGALLILRGRGAGLVGLAAAGALGFALAAVQALPTAEYLALSARAMGEGPSQPYAFDLEPYRVVEWAWPNVFGDFYRGEGYWLQAIPPSFGHTVWAPSLYAGGLTLVLALAGAGARGGPPWRAWLTAVAGLGLLASFGRHGGPSWWAGVLAGRSPEAGVGDAVGGVYWGLATFLPGFGAFRFPGKLLGVTTLAVCGLAGLGWDRVAAGRWRGAAGVAVGLLALTAGALAVSSLFQGQALAWLGSRAATGATMFGPLDPGLAFAALRRTLWVGGVVQAVALAVVVAAGRGWRRAGPAALVWLTADLAWNNAGLVFTVPQAVFEATPRASEAIRAAERDEPSGGPWRVHVMGYFTPAGWSKAGSPDRLRDWVAWERDALRPGYGTTLGFSYAVSTQAETEPYEYGLFFRPILRAAGPRAAALLGTAAGRRLTYFPRRGFDLWGARYFVTPASAEGWSDPLRSFGSFLDQTDLVYPSPEVMSSAERRRRWLGTDDVQIRRNRAAFPPAWVVHEALFLKPIGRDDAARRTAAMGVLLYQDDPLWGEPGRVVRDLRRSALIETERPEEWARFSVGRGGVAEGPVGVRRPSPTRVELEATLARPGFVILADLYYPGWRVTVDGAPAAVLRANRMMRGVAVGAGRHELVFTYEPGSVRLGAAVSLAALTGLGAMAAWARRQERLAA